MKRSNIILGIITLFLITGVNAQFKYGPRVGLGMTTLGGGNAGLGLQAGLTINAPIRDRFGFTADILFGRKGGNEKYTVPISHVDTVNGKAQTTVTNYDRKKIYHVTYIDIPVYFYFPFSEHISMLAGINMGIASGGTFKIKGDNLTEAEDKVVDITDLAGGIGITAGLDFASQSPLKIGIRFMTTGGEPFAGKSV